MVDREVRRLVTGVDVVDELLPGVGIGGRRGDGGGVGDAARRGGADLDLHAMTTIELPAGRRAAVQVIVWPGAHELPADGDTEIERQVGGQRVGDRHVRRVGRARC